MNKEQLRLDALKEKQKQLSAKILKLESLEKSKERKRDTRRKILIGSYFLDKAHQENKLSALYHEVEHYLSRDSDRELFQVTPEIEKNLTDK